MLEVREREDANSDAVLERLNAASGVFITGGAQPRLGQELAAGFVEADQGSGGINGAVIDVQHILHVPDNVGIGLGREAPLPNDESAVARICWAQIQTRLFTARSRPGNASTSEQLCRNIGQVRTFVAMVELEI